MYDSSSQAVVSRCSARFRRASYAYFPICCFRLEIEKEVKHKTNHHRCRHRFVLWWMPDSRSPPLITPLSSFSRAVFSLASHWISTAKFEAKTFSNYVGGFDTARNKAERMENSCWSNLLLLLLLLLLWGVRQREKWIIRKKLKILPLCGANEKLSPEEFDSRVPNVGMEWITSRRRRVGSKEE